MKECPRCGSEVQVIEGAYKRFECRSAMWGDETELDHQSDDCKHRSELTKLKSDVVRLRKALEEIANDCVFMTTMKQIAARALEETK